jgi:hypothetical protein
VELSIPGSKFTGIRPFTNQNPHPLAKYARRMGHPSYMDLV